MVNNFEHFFILRLFREQPSWLCLAGGLVGRLAGWLHHHRHHRHRLCHHHHHHQQQQQRLQQHQNVVLYFGSMTQLSKLGRQAGRQAGKDDAS